jgi:hypothetical protein
LLVLTSVCAPALCAGPALAAAHPPASWVAATASPQALRLTPFGAGRRARSVAIERASAAASGRSSTTAPHASQLTGGETGEISGTVTDATTTNPVAGIKVCAYTPEEPGVEEPLESTFFERCETTKAGGEYLLKELPVGSYEVEFFVPPESTLNYVTQYYEGSESPELESVKLVAVKAAEASTGVNAALTPGGGIAGTVVALSTQAPLAQIVVCAFETGGFSSRCSTTNANGEYELATLASGSYEVIFVSSGEYQLAELTAIVTAPNTTPSIDAQLAIEVPINIKPPVLSGTAAEGQTLTFAHGLWENSPTSYLDEWGLCGATGVITTCHTVATGPSFTLTAADVGHTIRVREYASNSSGESAQPGISLATGLVSAAAPVVASPVVPAAVGVTPVVTPKSGVEASTASAPSRRQLEAVLLGALTPKGKNAKIGALLGHKGYVVKLHVLAAGQVTISWYATPKTAHAKQVLVASGRIVFARAGTTKITIKLTSKGRTLLGQSSELKLSAKGTITASGQHAIAIAKRFVAKR